jgi:hypothetical protein
MAEGAPTHGRRLKKVNFFERLFGVCLQMMSEHAEDPGWETRESVDQADDDSGETNRAMGEEALLRLADVCALCAPCGACHAACSVQRVYLARCAVAWTVCAPCVSSALQALGSKSMLPVLFPMIGGLMRSPEWQQRHAGVAALTCVAEAFPQGEADQYHLVADQLVLTAQVRVALTSQ